MSQDAEILKKQSFRQNIHYVIRLVKLIHSLDHSFYVWNFVSVIMKAVITYGALLLSSFVINGLSSGTDYAYILKVTVGAAILLSGAASIDYFIDKHLEVAMNVMETQYMALQQEKIMNLDYALIDSPRLKEIRERMRLERNWGAGIYSMFWREKDFLIHLLKLVAALILLFPQLQYFKGKVQTESIGIFLFLFAIMIVGVFIIRYLSRMYLYMCFHIPTKEEKKWSVQYTWDFVWHGKYDSKNGKDVRIYDAYPLMKAYTYDKLQAKEFKKNVFYKFSMIYGSLGIVNNFVSASILAGSYLIAVMIAKEGNLSAGNVILFGGCLSNFLMNLFSVEYDYLEILRAALQQAGIFELFDLTDEMYKGSLPMEKRSDGEYQIEFKNVSFHYPGSKEYALKNLSMKLQIGEKLAIVGRNGSGKTTMIKLLCRLYDPDEGEILLNGVNIKKFRHEEYETLFSVIFQDYILVSLKLSENVAANHTVDVDKVRKCLDDSGFGDRLQTLSQGIDAYLYKDYEEEGIDISGGEAQKIAIARALYKDAPFVLLDEPTAALDPIAESEIYTNFDKIVGNKTAVYISHRLSSCKFCDRIAVFKDGQLVQYGNHDTLLKDHDGEYAVMWNKQAKYYTA